ncbi:MAG: CPBP family intramembrane metalloprotease [Planctomycetota bacterium]|nr:CPBP family intramembrane metalloprotease [Planctomycetota bacterium]
MVLKLLAAGLSVVVPVLLVRLLWIPAVEAVFHPSVATTSLLRRASIFLGVLGGYWAHVRYQERRPATELRCQPGRIALGALSGAGMISITTVILFASGTYELTAYRGPELALLGVASLIWVAAFLEEITYRCILFRILEEAWGTSAALWLQSLVFAAWHLGNVKAQATEMITTMVAVTLIGAFWTSIYVRTRSLWVVTAHHAAWNFAIVWTGLPLSGIEDWRAVAPIESRYDGPVWLTGGAFGPEGSVLTLVVVSLGLAVMLRGAKPRRREIVAHRSSVA